VWGMFALCLHFDGDAEVATAATAISAARTNLALEGRCLIAEQLKPHQAGARRHYVHPRPGGAAGTH